MPPTLPLWLTGPGITACTITPQTVNATTGDLTDTTPVATLFGHVDALNQRGRKTTEEISPMDTQRENYVPIKRSTNIEVTEILKSAGQNLLARAWYSSADYHKVVLTRSTQTGNKDFTFYGLFASYDENYARGKNVGVGTFMMV